MNYLLERAICCPYTKFSPWMFFPSSKCQCNTYNKLSSAFKCDDPEDPNTVLNSLLLPLASQDWSNRFNDSFMGKPYIRFSSGKYQIYAFEATDEPELIDEDTSYYQHSDEVVCLGGLEDYYGQSVMIFEDENLVGLFTSISDHFYFSYNNINWCSSDGSISNWYFTTPLTIINSIIKDNYH